LVDAMSIGEVELIQLVFKLKLQGQRG